MKTVSTSRGKKHGMDTRDTDAGELGALGWTMLEKRSYVMEHLDHCRKFLMREPRGHDGMYGAILTSPVTPDGDIGVLFMDNGGMGTMCGHGTIGVTKKPLPKYINLSLSEIFAPFYISHFQKPIFTRPCWCATAMSGRQ